MDPKATESLWASLAAERVDYALVGGLAMFVHGLPRFTEDIDLFVKLERENIEKLKRALKVLYSDPDIDEIRYEDLSGDYPVLRYLPPHGPAAIDIICRLGDKVMWNDLDIIERAVGDSLVRVVSPASLLKMKESTVRPIDAQDAERLRRAFHLD